MPPGKPTLPPQSQLVNLDKRGMKLKSGRELGSYLQKTLWFECGVITKLIHAPGESHFDYGLQFADWIANFVWNSIENEDWDALSIMQPYINSRRPFSDFQIKALPA